MSKVNSFTKTGTKQAEGVMLEKAVFGVAMNAQLVKDAYNAYLSNGRSAQPTTLTRGLVRGGGKKPWRQKGTGRARVGSIRVPNWRGGGVVFGPTGIENHIVQLPIKMKRLAVRQALSAQVADNRVVVIEAFEVDGKTKLAAELLGKIGTTGKVLIVVEDKTDLIDRATRNLPGVVVTQATYLNVFHVMNADDIVITKSALTQIEVWLGQKTAAKLPVADSTVAKSESKSEVTKTAKPQAEAKKPAAKKTVAKKPEAKS